MILDSTVTCMLTVIAYQCPIYQIFSNLKLYISASVFFQIVIDIHIKTCCGILFHVSCNFCACSHLSDVVVFQLSHFFPWWSFTEYRYPFYCSRRVLSDLPMSHHYPYYHFSVHSYHDNTDRWTMTLVCYLPSE